MGNVTSQDTLNELREEVDRLKQLQLTQQQPDITPEVIPETNSIYDVVYCIDSIDNVIPTPNGTGKGWQVKISEAFEMYLRKHEGFAEVVGLADVSTLLVSPIIANIDSHAKPQEIDEKHQHMQLHNGNDNEQPAPQQLPHHVPQSIKMDGIAHDEVEGDGQYSWSSSVVAVLGLYNKGKTYILNNLTSLKLRSGNTVHTEGLSFKVIKNKHVNHILLDTAGLYSPVIVDEEHPDLSLAVKKATEFFFRRFNISIS